MRCTTGGKPHTPPCKSVLHSAWRSPRDDSAQARVCRARRSAFIRHSRRAIHRFTDSPIHRFTDPSIHRSTDPPIHRAQAAQRAAYTGAPAPAPLARIFPARRSVRMPCYQTESFPPRAIAR
ncbi:hypothetical protein EGT65_05445 [Burkholderia mallei]|uniref:Uncharacterized protein n=1 Tax=Burkholderia mallei TaxID=13373 RepID=A0AAX1XB30_BURML|nr:hypothetical protein EGT70_02850 [Burkholderia mallei]RPA47522.1 hypothetical protein EGT65_05445 [Burkholderia mallei]